MQKTYADIDRPSLKASGIQVGDAIKPMTLNLTHTIIASTAIASRDFMPVHHDKDYALARFAPDIFLNILSTNGFMSRFLTDWAGPDAWIRKLSIKLGTPAVPHQALRFTGTVTGKSREGDEVLVEVSMKASNDNGDHATGTAVISLPATGG